MENISLFSSNLGIQTVMDMPSTSRMPEARPLAANILKDASLDELFRAGNTQSLFEDSLCPEVGDGDLVRPDIFNDLLASVLETLQQSSEPAVKNFVEQDLLPLVQNKALLNAYSGLMVAG